MANVRTQIDIDINTSAAAAGLRSLQSQINAFNTALQRSNKGQMAMSKGFSAQLIESVNASKYFAAEMVRMQSAAGALDTTLSKGQVTMKQFFSQKFIKDGLEASRVLSLANARAAALQTQFVATSAAANGFRDAVAIRPLEAFNKASAVTAQRLIIQRAMLQQATTSMINFGKNTQWAGRQLMVGFTVPLTIFGAVAGKTFMDLEKQAVNFKKVYGDAFTPPAELEANLKAVMELGKEYTKYGIALKDTVGLAAEAAAAGAQNKDLIDATTQATRLATLGQMEQNEALETTIALQNAFKLTGDDLAKSINFLNMVENQTVVTLQDLSAAIPRVAPVIKGLGGDVEDLAAFMAAMQEGGVSAEQGANALKSGLASLINPTTRAKERLDQFGISLDSIIMANKGDLMGTVQAFADALDTLDQFSRQQALEEVFGKFQYARLGALFDNINKDGTQAARTLELAGMSAAEMAASAEKELSAIENAVGTKFVAAMERLKAEIAPIGELFIKMATPIVNFLTTIAEKFNNLPDFAKKFILFGTVITGIIIPAGTMFLGLLMNLIGTLTKFGHLTTIFVKGLAQGGIRQALQNVTQATQYMTLAEIDATNAARQLSGATLSVNAALTDQVGDAAAATAAISKLAGSYANLAASMRGAAALAPSTLGLGAGAMRGRSIVGKPLPIVKRNRGGSIPYFGAGDTVPGSGNKDTVPAMLTPGEFIVNKEATAQNFDLLTAINDGNNVEYRNKGGGIATTGRRYYGRFPSSLAAARAEAAAAAQAQRDELAIIQALTGSRGLRSTSQSTSLASRSNLFETMVSRDTKPGQMIKILSGLGMRPDEFGLRSVGNYVLALSNRANDAMKRGVLSKQALLSELNANPGVAYGPIASQVTRYFGRGFDSRLFDTLYRQELGRVKDPISDATFRKLSRNALRRYLDSSGFDRNQRKSFLRDIVAGDTVRGGASVTRIKQVLAQNGVPFTQSGDDVYATIGGRQYNFGQLTAKSLDDLGRPSGISSYRDLQVPAGMVRAHANKGGMIPGVQYLFGGGRLLRAFTRVSGRVPGFLPRALIGTSSGFKGRQKNRILESSAALGRGDLTLEDISGRSVQRGHVLKGIRIPETNTEYLPGLMIFQSPSINQSLAANNRGKVTGLDIARDLAGSKVHPFSIMLDAARRLGISDEVSIPAIKKTYDLALRKFGSDIGNKTLGPNEFYEVFDPILRGNLPMSLYANLRSQGSARKIGGDARSIGRFFMSESSPIKANDGRIVPGVGDKDTVPAMLTPGEFVINKQATRQNIDLLRSINNGEISGYNKGGGVARQGRMFYGDIDYGILSGSPNKVVDVNLAEQAGKRITPTGAGGRGGVMTGFGIQMLAGTAGFMIGSAVGEAVGGENGSMIGGIAGGTAPSLLPNRIGRFPTGGLLPAVGQGGAARGAIGLARLAPAMASPAGLAATGVAALVTTVAAVAIGMDRLEKSLSNFDKAMMGSTDRVEKLGEVFGRQTLTQIVANQKAAQRAGVTTETLDVANEFINTDAGKQLLRDMQTVQSMGGNRKDALLNQLSRGIFSGVISPEEARGIAIEISKALGNQNIGVQVSAEITSIFGPNGEKLRNNRLNIAASMVPEISAEQIDKEAEQMVKRMGKVDWSRGIDLGAMGASIITLGGRIVPESLKIQAEIKAIANKTVEASQIEQEARAGVILEYQNGIIALDEYMFKLEALNRMDISGTAFESAVGAVAGAATKSLGATVAPEEIMNVDFLNIEDLRNQESMIQNEINSITQRISGPSGLREAAKTRLVINEGMSLNEVAGLSDEELARLDKASNEFDDILSYLADAQSRFATIQRQIVVQEEAQSFFDSMNESTKKMLESAGYVTEEITGLEKLSEKLAGDRPDSTAVQAELFRGFAMNQFDPNVIFMLQELGDKVADLIPEGQDPVKFLNDMGIKMGALSKYPNLQQKIMELIIESEGGPSEGLDLAEQYIDAIANFETLPDDIVKTLKIDLSTEKGMEDFKLIQDSINNLMPSINQLSGEKRVLALNLLASANAKDITPKQFGADVKRIEDALADLDSIDPDIRKEAAIEYMSFLRDEDGNVIENPEEAMNSLIERFGAGKILNLPTTVLKEVFSHQLEIEGLQDQVDLMNKMAEASLTVDRKQYYIERANAFGEALKIAKRGQANTIRAANAGTTTSYAGGGGSRQKSILEKLQDEINQLKEIYNGVDRFIKSKTGQFKKVMAGPFGPEFIEFLKSQGEEGIKILNGKMGELKKVYNEYVKLQFQNAKNFAQTFPGSVVRQTQQMAAERTFRGRLSGQGIEGEVADQLVSGVGPEVIRTYERAKKLLQDPDVNFKDLSKNQQEAVKIVGEALRDATENSKEFNAELSRTEATSNIRDLRNESETLNKLFGMGYTQEQAEELMSIGISADLSAGEIRNLADEYFRLKDSMMTVEEAQKALAETQQQLLGVEDNIASLKAQIAIEENLRDDMDDLEALEKSNEAISRRIELEQRKLEPIDEAIKKLEEEKEKINEAYDAQFKALDEVARKEDQLARARQGRLDVASALSRGDVAGAAQAAIAMQREMAQQRQEETRAGLEAARQREIDAIQEDINAKMDERKAIEDAIKALQIEQRGIQDDIYNKQKFINDETERLEGLYEVGKNELALLKGELTAAANEQKRLADEAQRYKNIIAGGGGGNTSNTPPVASPVNGVTFDQPINTGIDWGNLDFSDLNLGWTLGKYGGKIGKYLMGGRVGFKGSREPAPGMMYGGRMKKYATGSFVPGIGMTDRVPAMLTPGEFVVRKSVAQQYGGLLSGLNSQIFPGLSGAAGSARFNVPGESRYSTRKGSDTPSIALATDNSSKNYFVTVNTSSTSDANEIANTVINKIKRSEARSVKGVKL